MAADVIRLKARAEALRDDKRKVESLWDDIEKFIMPATGRSNEPAGEQRSKLETAVEAWDLTGPLACEHLAASLHGRVTSPSSRWLDFEWQDPELERDHAAIKHREKLAELVWNELQASDFNTEISSAYHELVGLGTMILTAEPAHADRWEGLDFTAVPCREGDFEEDSKGGVRTFYRRLRWTPAQILDRFGEKGTPARIRELAKLPEGGTTRLDVIFCIYRREEVSVDAEVFPLIPEKRPFGSVYFTLEQAEQLGEKEGGYYEMPAVVVPWGRVPGSKWGFGRGALALRGVKWLNAFKESAREAAAVAARPPHVGTERGVLSDPDTGAGGYTVVSDPDQLKPLPQGARFDVSAEVLRDERAEIRRAFHEDDLQLKDSPQMTAEEVRARRDLANQVLGSPVGRLETGGLAPIVTITLRHLYRAGRLPKAPESVLLKKAELKVRFRGPIARAQMIDEVVGIERSAAFIASLVKMGFEKARFRLNLDATIREHQKRVGSPAAMLNSPQEAEKAEKEWEALQRAAAEAEIAKKQNEGARAGAQAAALAPPPPATGGGLSIAPQPAFAPSGAVVP